MRKSAATLEAAWISGPNHLQTDFLAYSLDNNLEQAGEEAGD